MYSRAVPVGKAIVEEVLDGGDPVKTLCEAARRPKVEPQGRPKQLDR
jgi:hypothetical protein